MERSVIACQHVMLRRRRSSVVAFFREFSWALLCKTFTANLRKETLFLSVVFFSSNITLTGCVHFFAICFHPAFRTKRPYLCSGACQTRWKRRKVRRNQWSFFSPISENLSPAVMHFRTWPNGYFANFWKIACLCFANCICLFKTHQPWIVKHVLGAAVFTTEIRSTFIASLSHTFSLAYRKACCYSAR